MNNSSRSAIAVILTGLSSALVSLLSLLAPLWGSFSSKIRTFFEVRKLDPAVLSKISEVRKKHTRCVVFYCSSAGEYEQARPIAAHLVERCDVYVHFLFFSQSGLSFAQFRKEPFAFSLAPVDTFGNWKQLLDVLEPDSFLIIRHELWPACLRVASQRCPVYLVNASLKSGGSLRLFIKSLLLSFVSRIYTVSEFEKTVFKQQFSTLNVPIRDIGDSKYDRVLERVAKLQNQENRFSFLSHTQPRIIVGSAWPKDAELALSAFSHFRKTGAAGQLLVAPHQPDLEFLGFLESECEKLHLTCSRLSQITGLDKQFDVVLVDSVGQLFDLYSCCDLAFVGGALHHKVHNVLEPAAFALPVAFGPFFSNSHEACELVQKNLVTIVKNADEFFQWMEPLLRCPQPSLALRQFLETKAGATERLVSDLVSEFRS